MKNFGFEPLNIEQKDIICEFLKYNQSISCEFCIGNLLTWNKVENTEYCIHDDVLYLKNNINDKYNYYFPMFRQAVPEEEIIEIINNLYNFHLYNYSNVARTFNLVHLTEMQAQFLEKFCAGRFEIYSDRNHSEYIYEAESFRTYSGKKLHSKKNHLNKFYSMYGDNFGYEQIGDANIDECRILSHKWSEVNTYYLNASMKEELNIVNEHFDNYKELDLIGGCIRVDGNIKGFTIGSASFEGSDTVIVQVEKAMYEIEGIYPAIASHFLQANPQFKYVNREDDLGDEGLRKSKLSYRPLYLLDKYTATAKIK